MESKIWTNIKTQEDYVLLKSNIINSTNDQDGQLMIMYMNPKGQLFVREETEFLQKFRKKV